MATILTKDDLPAALQTAESIDLMLAGANGTASRVAPCLAVVPAPDAEQIAEAKLILLGAIKRWVEAGSGALQSQAAGPFQMSVDTRQKSSGYRLWPSEIADLQSICTDPNAAKQVFAVDTASNEVTVHADICAVNFGALYCSCAADIAGSPLYEQTEDAC